jgi:hypothetical protein
VSRQWWLNFSRINRGVAQTRMRTPHAPSDDNAELADQSSNRENTVRDYKYPLKKGQP